MQKAITSVVSVILLVLIVIAMVGFSYFFFVEVESSGEETGTGEVERATTYEKFKIENTLNDKLYIRNLGLEDLSGLEFFADNESVDVISDCPGGSVGSNQACDDPECQFFVCTGHGSYPG